MEIEKEETEYNIEGAPRTGNTFIRIGTAYNVNPNATKVENTFNIYSREAGDAAIKEAVSEQSAGRKLSSMSLREMLKEGLVNTSNIQTEILNYVSSIRPYVKEEMDKTYMQLWACILEHEAFKVDLYDPGKQDCHFNRNLIGNILHYLNGKDFYKVEYNQSQMTRKLEGDEQNAVRKALRFDPEEKYCKVIDKIITEIKDK